MKGIIVTEATFENQLVFDEIFVEYFNAFLALPAFPKVVQYDNISGTFHDAGREQKSYTLAPSEDVDSETFQREKVLKWVKKERLPLFLRTKLYLQFKLCRLLLRKLKDFRSTARGSSRGIRGYSRASNSGLISPQVDRPSSNASNRSWPGVPIKHFGRRPLGSATSLPGMLRLALGDEDSTGLIEDEMEKLDVQDGKDKSTIQNAQKVETSKILVEENGEAQGSDQSSNVDSEQEGIADDELKAVMEFQDPDDAQTEADAKSIASKHKITLQELKEQALGSLQGLTLFRSFLEETVGVHLYDFWLDVERYKDSLQYEPEERIREHRMRLFREILDKHKNYLTLDAKEQIERALFNGGVTQDLFTRTQYDVLRRLRSYWVPRFLVHLERNEDYGDDYFSLVNPRDQYRPGSSLSFFPSLSLVHSIPPLGDWCREMVRSRKWDRDILIKDKRRKSVSQRLNAIPEGVTVDPFMSALKAEKDAGYPFKRYLQNHDKTMLAQISFWLDVKEFAAAEKRSGDRYLSRCNAWNIFNRYLAAGSELSIGLHPAERKRIERILHSSEELPTNLFTSSENFIIGVLRVTWEDFKDFDQQTYRIPPGSTTGRILTPSASQVANKGKEGDYYSPSTGRWVKRHPGSSPSERGRRLYTSLAMAEESDAIRGSSSSSPKRSYIPPPSTPSRKTRGNKNKKKSRNNKNLVVRRKRKAATSSTSDEEDSDSTEDKPEKPAQPVEPDFVDVVDNKSTMTSFKQYVQNMEGRQAFNQLVMYLEIEQYNTILPSKKIQKTQQSTSIYKTFFDPTSRRAVALPSQLLGKIEAERPTTPVLIEAQMAVRPDVESYFKSFFKTQHEARRGAQDGTHLSTPKEGSRVDGLDAQQSFLQFYRRKAQKKAKNTGRVQPTKDDREEFKRILLSTQGKLPLKLELYRRYLQNHGDPDSFPKLENDLLFYLEVQKLKDLFNYLDDTSLNRKVETIIECFLDSATPPWLQIDISSELAARIIHKAQTFSTAKRASREHKDPGLFDEAQSIIFKELLPYWAGFCKQYKPLEFEGGAKLPPTKQEKTVQRRYNEFIKYQAVTDTLVLPPVSPGAGQSRTEATFSVSDGMRWKDRREVDAISVMSSTQGSVSGGLATRKKSSVAGSSAANIIEVGS